MGKTLLWVKEGMHVIPSYREQHNLCGKAGIRN